MLKSPIKLGNWYQGQSSLGKLQQDSFVELTNVDVHRETGLITCQNAMESESTTPNEACVFSEDTVGNVYACSTTSGKIWKRTTDGSWSLLHTNTNGAHTGTQYFNGYLWYWTSTKLGHFNLSSTFTDSFNTGGNAFRGSVEANNSLLIANGRYIARIDSANTLSLTELTLPAQYKATCLKNVGDDVLIGTYVSTSTAYCRIFLWNTVSPSWTYEDEVFEIGINCFIQLDNITVAQCGVEGRFYYWTGSRLAQFGKIRGITTALGEQKSAVLNGRPLFANGTKIYSIHKEVSILPYAFVGEYTCTGTINALFVQGQNILASVGTGVDKRGTSFATGTIITPEIQAKVSSVEINYDTYPEGIGIETSINGEAYVSQTSVTNTTEKTVSFNGGMVDGQTLQTKITLTPDGTDRPIIKSISLR